MKLIKKTLVAAALTGAFIGSANAMVYTDGGSTVTYSSKIQVGINAKVFMTTPDDILVSFLSDDNETQVSSFCVATNVEGGAVSLELNTENANNDTHNLNSGSNLHPYKISISGEASTPGTTHQITNPLASCDGGVNNVAMEIDLNPDDADIEAITAGLYRDTLTFTVSVVESV